MTPPQSDGVYAVIACTANNTHGSNALTYQLAIHDSEGTTLYLARDESLNPGDLKDAIITTSEPVIITDNAVLKVRQVTGTADTLNIRIGFVRVV